ncbi:iron-containing alcohol dehydrogenase [Corallococcus sp. AB004]|uniref:iron-containing alcohol dehydrogenase n=1 Tax=Corallococcus exiguus TaxID=83462 RepID=UPI000EA1B82D|nr:iron-containing alcohol dehydrogenase [Corallococcus exiguus]NPD23261.1 iron-containing alcohol dehydrogenase [Corallococcus exiguus]NRD48131.1 iron-containing alcohol dehydrogenase [Corallococcus exiguus]RKI47183.1 iron-containing alcohol dehydrogenase [Corallococcus sp. AB004]
MKTFDIPSEPRVTEMAWPTRIVFGAGALQKLPAHAARLNMKRPLLVTDAGVVKAGLAARVADVLKGAGLECAVFDRVEPNPTERDVFAGLEAYRAHKADGIVALGGGSALDAGKLVQLLTTHEPPLSRYDDAKGGDQYVRDDLPPLIAIPTTAGTGSEVGRSGVVTLADTGRKTVIFSPYLLPKAAVIDPELTLGLPPSVTAATGMDALTHCIEAYVANGFHPLADAVAIDGVMRVGRSLVTAVQEGRDLAARTDMMVAAMEGAMAFQKGLGASHALAHALTPISNVPHGLANAIVLPAVMEFNRASCTARLARIATALGDTSNAREEVLAANAIDRVRKLAASVGIPTRLREAGVQEKDLEHIAQKAFQDASHQGNPRTVTEADLLAMAREAY